MAVENATNTKSSLRARIYEEAWRPQHGRTFAGLEPGIATIMGRAVFGQVNWPLVFLGDIGSGKTCAALVMLDFFGGNYFTFAEWCQRVRDAQMGELFDDNGYKIAPTDLWDALGKVNLFVLDELGLRAGPTGPQVELLSRTIDLRRRRPTIYISNLTLEQLGHNDMYTDRIPSRLSEGTTVKFEGDRRVAAALEAEPGGDDE